jgi:hypothetical protein
MTVPGRKTRGQGWGERPACPDPRLHQGEPLSYMAWDEVDRMMVDHVQLRCPACGLWSVIVKRASLPGLPCILCPRTDGIDWAEQTFPGQDPPARLIPLCPGHWADGFELEETPPFSNALPSSTAAYPPPAQAKSSQVREVT